MIDEKKLIEDINNHIKWMNNEAKTKSDEDVISGLKVALALIEDQKKIGEWIPCCERLPKRNKNVLGCGKYGGMYIVQYQGDKDGSLRVWTTKYEKINCAAWMPLPEPYKEESNV